jgi:hypothetical protein
MLGSNTGEPCAMPASQENISAGRTLSCRQASPPVLIRRDAWVFVGWDLFTSPAWQDQIFRVIFLPENNKHQDV